MARPRKWRKVCCLPSNDRFGPLNDEKKPEQIVFMTIDEYETIRLIDQEGFTQEQCAEQMDIARTTVQGMYNSARKKLAELVVNGKMLRIEGGEYRLCNESGECCGNGCRRRRHGRDRQKCVQEESAPEISGNQVDLLAVPLDKQDNDSK
ncbi:putative DNA-binding protein (UPF0251 family) [Trichococcus patagoniensis]|uniref:UPF0251 protein C8U37_10850 n=1 Tax=Trichococcus patagoniensis TaxID=382641 RepID=A0A2T5IL03_9LACT|nr:DUF134 domain-containing protein [Trichococcus patagoniensis]PTQ84483.1 putative DNA-binding protein (UPF0251 family) [Trichococcus patagoniensis]